MLNYFPLSSWKIRVKHLFSLSIVIIIFLLVTKLIWESFTWMILFAKTGREETKVSEGKGKGFSTFMF